jgi:hypothetical protein
MKNFPLSRRRWAFLTVVALGAALAPPARAADPVRFRTGPRAGAPRDIALDYVRQNAGALGLSAGDVAEVVVTDQYTSGHTGVTHIYLRQAHEGLEVVDANMNVNVARDGSILNLGHAFVRNLSAAIQGGKPVQGALQAAQSAARHLGLAPEALVVQEDRGGAASEQLLSRASGAGEPIPAKLVYQPVGDVVRLAWQLLIEEPSGDHWWRITVDAETGAVLAQFDYVVQDFWRPDPGFTSGAGTAEAESSSSLAGTESYNVFALPKESPYDGGRSLEVAPAEAVASPFGWHDTDGASGPEFTVTRGNNVHAYTDLNADNVVDPGSDPDGGASLTFDFPLDLTLDPSTYRPAAVTNLFYWNNVVHDVFYQYGFDEAGGNFQVNNYGRGGLGADDVRAEAQDGSGTNNANFGTPPDGMRPRMQMFIWTGGLPYVVTVNGGPIAGNYVATGAAFGPRLDDIGPRTADVALGVDGGGASTTDGCEPLVGFPPGGIALVDRGTCNFTVKVANAQAAGAVGVIVANNVAGNPITMGGADPTITIPSVMVRQDHGDLFKANLPFNGTLRVNPDRPVSRDSDLDAGVIAHEYGHGISNRLTGGPSTTSCLGNAEQMGEGWSDFTALVLTAKAGQTAVQPRGIGNYVSFRPADGPGIRPAPYTTDLAVNPVTYGDIGGLAIPHGVGYAWASMLWEVYWNLVQARGYNPDPYADWTTGGNNLAVQLVVDGMKLQVCRPGFVDGRDAILLADQALTGGANQCHIWKGFAKRGLGLSASQGLNTSTTDGVEAFDLPAQCTADIDVDPDSLSATVEKGDATMQSLTVSNTATDGGTDLDWTITEAPADCAAPGDVPWLSAAPVTGTTAAAGGTAVGVTFDSTGLGVGTYTAKLCVASNDADEPVVEVPVSLRVIYDFDGFFPPVRNEPHVNVVKAGSVVPVAFSLDGNQGPNPLAAGSPTSQQVDCSTLAPIGPEQPTRSVLGLGLIRIPFLDVYLYLWDTNRSWDRTCRRLHVRLNDGTDHTALFRFR